MKQIEYIFILIFVLGFINPANAQVSKDSELFKDLKTNDSLLFNIGFNECDMKQFKNLITDDLEFYHDKAGVINSKVEFINAITNGICKKGNPYRSRRELELNSLTLYPLYQNGELYGAIQNGIHLFYEMHNDRPETLNSTAMFSHLWILVDDRWKIKRIFSFDHQAR